MVINDFNLFDVTSSLNNGTIVLQTKIGLKHMPQLLIKYINKDTNDQQLHAIMHADLILYTFNRTGKFDILQTCITSSSRINLNTNIQCTDIQVG